jgi:hypothetical protein
MTCGRWALGAVACSAAIACGGGEGSGRAVNRPPVVAKGSLSWIPPDAKVSLGVPYEYSVKATDPDIGDAIVRYEWVFSSGASLLAALETAVGSVTHTLAAWPHGTEDGTSAIEVKVRATDSEGAVGQYEAFAVPVVPGALDGLGDPDDPNDPDDPR